jgi:pimeloyl-ACP methyl ester carboxylesterase
MNSVINRASLKFLSILILLFTLAACGAKNSKDAKTIQVAPVSDQEARALRLNLETGLPTESFLDQDNFCSNPMDTITHHGTVTVPEDYSKPDGRKIKVFYYARLQEGQTPVVFYNGGPGSDSHASAQLLERLFDVARQSFVYIDQRGTGCSDPFPTEATEESVERLTHYGSTEIVKDSEVVREKLLGAGSKWKVFGQSYGGLITHRYAMTAPASVAGAFAHGFSVMKDATQWLKLRVKSQKRVSELYFTTYPNDRARLAKLRESISEGLCFTDGGTKVCGRKLTDALTIFLGFSDAWGSLHQNIIAMMGPDGKLNQAALEKFVRNYVFGVYNHNGLAASVISVVEISNGQSDADSCRAVQAELTVEGEDPESWPINECRLLTGMENNQWAEVLKSIKISLAMTPDQLKASLEKNPKLPFHLYSGEKDVFVPYETFQEEVKALGSRINYRQFPNSGHEGFHTEQDVWQDMLKIH